MPTRADSRSGGLADAARHVADHATTILRLELRLAAQEVKRKTRALGVGVVLLLAAALLATLIVPLLLAAAVAALALVLPVWESFLIVAGALVLAVGPIGVAGLVALKRGSPPVPEQALKEARLTTEALKNGRH